LHKKVEIKEVTKNLTVAAEYWGPQFSAAIFS